MSFLSFLLFYCLSLFTQVLLIEYKGDVYWRVNSLSSWEKVVSLPLEIPQSGAIKLDEKSYAKLLINNKSEIFVYEESAVEIESVSQYYVAVGLVYGKGKFNISFPTNSTFVLKTITADFTARKMISIVEADLYGKAEVYMGLGECEFEYRIPHKSGKRSFILSQGMYFKIEDSEKPYVFGVVDSQKEEEIFEDTNLEYEEKMITRKKRIEKIASFTSYALKLTSRYTTDVIKEKNSDFESARTLYDIHGNMVRVEQRIFRPYPDKIQFLSITKRLNYPSYTNTLYTNSQIGFQYKGGNINNRLDLFSITFSFNKNLPENIMNFPSFFADPSVRAEWASFVAANISSNLSFFVAEAYKYNLTRGELINNTESVGVLQDTNDKDNDVIITGKIAKSDLYDILNYNFVEKNTSSPTGNLVRKTDGSDINGAFWGLKTNDDFEINGDIYQLKGSRYRKGGVGNDYFWITSENYIISPFGKVRKKKEIEYNFDGISEVVSKNFLESIIYIKNDNSGNAMDNSYNSIDDNIDLIIDGVSLYSSFENMYEGIRRWKD